MCNFFSFLVHFVPNIPDDHMITIWTMLRAAPRATAAARSRFFIPKSEIAKIFVRDPKRITSTVLSPGTF